MRRILLDNISSRMKLAKPLYSSDGTVLFNAGTQMNAGITYQLKKLKVTYVYIEEDSAFDIDVPDVINEKTRVNAVASVKELFEKVRLGQNIDLNQIRKTVDLLVSELSKNKGMVNFIDMRTVDDYLYSHSVNVCVLSIMAGISIGYDKECLNELGVGALLHDIGKLGVSPELLAKNGRFSQQEEDEIKEHPLIGFNILDKNPKISSLSAQCVMQHHERINGSGYPKGCKGDEINRYAQIVGIADVYDALVSGSCYRRATSVYEAIALIKKASGTCFNNELVQVFTDNIAVYPIGSVVRLSNKQIGVVVDVSRESKTKPVLRILLDENKVPVTDFSEIDLSKNTSLYIADTVER
ncbi:HD-GYP domain-containing protein [Dendrosporobacter sp. 1207_IL3150]|uniref:HD-GYP domain-containing protein n=1 Tax=Dendrosporobacter sp. 1207_IL3150 TaxID=3084054 RepID=UPI002FD8E936